MAVSDKIVITIFLLGAIVALNAFYRGWKKSKFEITSDNNETQKKGYFLASVSTGIICLVLSLFLKSAYFIGGDPEGVGIAIILSFFLDIILLFMLVNIYKLWPRKKK